MCISLEGQVARVTGGSRERAAAEIGESGCKVRGAQLDVADSAAVVSTLKTLLADYGTIPLLLNNAGITRDNLLLRMKEEDWDVAPAVLFQVSEKAGYVTGATLHVNGGMFM